MPSRKISPEALAILREQIYADLRAGHIDETEAAARLRDTGMYSRAAGNLAREWAAAIAGDMSSPVE